MSVWDIAPFTTQRLQGSWFRLIRSVWLAQRWGGDFAIGTGLWPDGTVAHFWPRDKPRWLLDLAKGLGIATPSIAAVGDSAGDLPMLQVAGRGFFVGDQAPSLPDHVSHWPNANIDDLARALLAE